MSILVKPYEISVWEDVWDSVNEKFIERRILVIGSDLMNDQCRALKPNLTVNVNGTKKFSFQIQKTYRDLTTGKKVENPFFKYLTNERKVKLYYKNKWYDFLIKNITEESKNYLYSYQLEDAFVNELSKNGFNIELDAKLRNNLGTARELAEEALKTTDWTVSDQTESFVQQNEEALIYLKTAGPVTAISLKDQSSLTKGIEEKGSIDIPSGSTILAFYSCCKDKPHRFQFIWVPDGQYCCDDKRVLTNKDCQCFIDYISPETDYISAGGAYQFSIPRDFVLNDPGANSLSVTINSVNKTDEKIVSVYLRGKRYVFAHKTHFVTLLNRYMNLYNKDGIEYYGYVDSDYFAPTLITNLIDNTEFLSTSGWTAARRSNEEKPTVEVSYGRWDNSVFTDIQTDWLNGIYENSSRKSRLKIAAGAKDSISKSGLLINNGFYANRTTIKNITPNQQFILRVKLLDSLGEPVRNPMECFQVGLYNTIYNTNSGNYNIDQCYTEFDSWKYDESGYATTILKINNLAKDLTEKEFKNKKIKLVFILKNTAHFYIEDAQLFHYIEKNDGFMTPDDQSTEAQVTRTYKYYIKSQFDYATTEEELVCESLNAPDYATYKPVYSMGAEKIRTITAKESNYFNILQNIAETFEAWLDIDIERSADGQGTPIRKKIAFKNYTGKNNYTGFKYGVNLKDITRTKDGQKIATKLIVKDNKNQYAAGGACSITNAPSNESGENFLYNFDYYIGAGLLDPVELNNYLYHSGHEILPYWKSKLGLDASAQIGYYSYLGVLNSLLKNKQNSLSPLKLSKNKLEAEIQVLEATYSAAQETSETLGSDFEDLTGFSYVGNSLISAEETLTSDRNAIATIEFVVEGTEPLETVSAPKQSVVPIIVNADTAIISNQIKPTASLTNNISGQAQLSISGLTLSGSPALASPAGKAVQHSLLDLPRADFETNGKLISTSFSIATPFVPTSTSTPTDQIVSKITRGVISIPAVSVPNFYEIESITYYLVKDEEETSIIVQGPFNLKNGLVTIEVPAEKLDSYSIKTVNTRGNTTYDTTQVQIKYRLTKASKTSQENYIKALEREDVQKLLQELYIAADQQKQSSQKLTEKERDLATLITQITNLQTEVEAIENEKRLVNQLFYSRFYRFIQEGTWVSEEYTDPESYFIDSQAVLYSSCYPAVTYNLNVVELSQLPEYSLLEYALGDRTYVEDYEFFGSEGRIAVVVTETTDNLDRPDQNSITIQTYKNQFQELFQKITATVQTAEYNSGAYAKAAQLADANKAQKEEYLKGAIDNITSLLNSGGECSIDQDVTGITIKDLSSRGNQMKLTSGGILLGSFDSDTGENKWVNGMSSKGIAADLITAGKIDTGQISIMNGKDATFRWDAFGLSAFDFDDATMKVNPTQFVRFDKYGLYGVAGKDGTTWRANSFDKHVNGRLDENSVKGAALFYLTWDGLSLTPQNSTYQVGGIDVPLGKAVNAKLGKVDNNIYNTWSERGYPVYDSSLSNGQKFVKIFAVGEKPNAAVGDVSENFVLYSDGTLVTNNIKLTGSVQWTESASPSKSLYGIDKNYIAPTGSFGQYPDDAPITNPKAWHKNYTEGVDLYYYHTDNGGLTWEGPFDITSRSIVRTDTFYLIEKVGLTASELDAATGWEPDYPKVSPYAGQCVYVQTKDIYSDGQFSSRYSAGPSPIGDLTLATTALAIQEDSENKLTPKTITLTVTTQNLPDGTYQWYKDSKLISNVTGTVCELQSDQIFDGESLSVTYTVSHSSRPEYTDSITLIKVKEGIEGQDAIAMVLTNPSMVFNDGDAFNGTTETTRVQVYQGTKQIKYSKNTTSGMYYQISSDEAHIGDDGLITITNPRKTKTITLTIQLYKDGVTIGQEQSLNIICSVVSDGEDAVLCYIDSSAGTLLQQGEDKSVTLYARMIQKGINIVNKYTCTWYRVGNDGPDTKITNGNGYEISTDSTSITTSSDNLVNCSYYFTAEPK